MSEWTTAVAKAAKRHFKIMDGHGTSPKSYTLWEQWLAAAIARIDEQDAEIARLTEEVNGREAVLRAMTLASKGE